MANFFYKTDRNQLFTKEVTDYLTNKQTTRVIFKRLFNEQTCSILLKLTLSDQLGVPS